jgi:3',5'-cyclic AMP phosphodiesterase CpdA
VEVVRRIKPDLLAISGDLTQRARAEEFKAARVFLDALPSPQIVVPGNHDVPLHNLYARFRAGLDGFRQFITDDFEPFFGDAEIAVLGVNTARTFTWKSGRINTSQISMMEDRFRRIEGRVKILVSHHPFDLPEHYAQSELVGRAHVAMAGIARCGVDLMLAGHLHVSHSGHTAARYNIAGHSAIFLQAGTALSTRSRGESNSFNVIRIERERITIERHTWDPATRTFESSAAEEFHRSEAGWFRRD